MPDPDQIIEIALTAEQTARLLPLIREQPIRRKGLLFVTVGPTVTSTGTLLRLQAKWIAWPRAQAVLRLINSAVKTASEVAAGK
jgi:hypothetical protein